MAQNRPTKQASEIKTGDKIYTSEKPNSPSVVTASYELGTNWALEVEGLQHILQVKPDDQVLIFPY
jgi:hypothetical protein